MGRYETKLPSPQGSQEPRLCIGCKNSCFLNCGGGCSSGCASTCTGSCKGTLNLKPTSELPQR